MGQQPATATAIDEAIALMERALSILDAACLPHPAAHLQMAIDQAQGLAAPVASQVLPFRPRLR